MTEIWKDVEGYEGLYQVSNLRQVKSLNYRRTGKERILRQYNNQYGYLYVDLCKDGEKKCCRIHRLVAQAFIPNLKNLPEVNHKDENSLNNCVNNLEWCTAQYNSTYGTRIERINKKLTKTVKCVETGALYTSITEAHEKTGISACNISSCVNGKLKTARRYHWIKV